MVYFYKQRTKEGYKAKDLEMMPIPEFISFIKDWVNYQRP